MSLDKLLKECDAYVPAAWAPATGELVRRLTAIVKRQREEVYCRDAKCCTSSRCDGCQCRFDCDRLARGEK